MVFIKCFENNSIVKNLSKTTKTDYNQVLIKYCFTPSKIILWWWFMELTLTDVSNFKFNESCNYSLIMLLERLLKNIECLLIWINKKIYQVMDTRHDAWYNDVLYQNQELCWEYWGKRWNNIYNSHCQKIHPFLYLFLIIKDFSLFTSNRFL